MSTLFDNSAAAAAAALIVLLPLLILGFGELSERLRQRGSVFQYTVSLVRNWVLPLFALWALVVWVFEVDEDNVWVRWLGTALLSAVAITLLALTRALVAVARERSEAPGRKRIPELLFLIPRLAVIIIAFWVLFNEIWNVDLSGLAAALGVGTLVVSLALQDTLSGLASGMLLLGDRPFSPGDWIKVDDLEGRVVDVNWRSSRIEDRNGDLRVIPNSSLAGATLTNFDEPTTLHRVTVDLQVAYSNPPTRAKEMLLAAARATPGVLEDPAPVIRVVSIDDPLMGYQAQMWIDDYTIAPRVSSDFGALVWYQSHRMGVPLPSPAYDLYHHDPIQEAADAELGPVDIADRIRHAPMLADLPADDLRELAEAARCVKYRERETILTAGAVNRDLFVMWEGIARVMVSGPAEEPIDVLDLGAGDLFGLLSRSDRLTEPPAVVAVTDCEIVVIGAEAAGAVTSRNPDLSEAMNKMMTARRRRVDRVEGIGAGIGLQLGDSPQVGAGVSTEGDAGNGTSPGTSELPS